MSTPPRHLSMRDLPKREPGLCRYCGEPIPKGRRRTWCSQECVDQYLVRSGITLRSQVRKRDRGVCSACGLDCIAFKDTLQDWWRSVKEHHYRLASEALFQLGLLRFLHRDSWEIDHIVPVSDGGGACDLANLRTLCWRCHAAETRELAKRQADKRRGRQRLL